MKRKKRRKLAKRLQEGWQRHAELTYSKEVPVTQSLIFINEYIDKQYRKLRK